VESAYCDSESVVNPEYKGRGAF
ncbi:MAG: hypothetical protein QOF53_3241, partial [Nocardioidaceae bacterium]|nr:hypothetical protein [Nocardioidaceae bacterium]